jgi:hypothetical protein
MSEKKAYICAGYQFYDGVPRISILNPSFLAAQFCDLFLLFY